MVDRYKVVVDRYKEKKDWNRQQSGGSPWKSPFYDELDAVLGNRDVVTFQHVAQASAAKTSNPPSSGEDSPPRKKEIRKQTMMEMLQLQASS